jgi:hypothetical protein
MNWLWRGWKNVECFGREEKCMQILIEKPEGRVQGGREVNIGTGGIIILSGN